jgi:hypothetical protein
MFEAVSPAGDAGLASRAVHPATKKRFIMMMCNNNRKAAYFALGVTIPRVPRLKGIWFLLLGFRKLRFRLSLQPPFLHL